MRITRPAAWTRSFVAAVHDKYASELATGQQDPGTGTGGGTAPGPQIVISGKVAEEVGFDKIRRRLARLDDLKIVIVDGKQICSAVDEGERSVAETCPRIVELDLSRNLFGAFGIVVDVCRELGQLRILRVKYVHSTFKKDHLRRT